MKPSEQWARQGFAAGPLDAHEMITLEEIGVRNLAFGSDDIHTEGTWPNTRASGQAHSPVSLKRFAGPWWLATLASPQGNAAIDDERMPGYEGRCVRCEKHRSAFYLADVTDAAQWSDWNRG